MTRRSRRLVKPRSHGIDTLVVYREVRRVHVERHDVPGRVVLYQRLNYDLGEAAPDGHFFRRGTLRTTGAILRARPRVLELNEPAAWRTLPLVSMCLLAAGLLGIFGVRPIVVTYAIENLDPIASFAGRFRLRYRTARLLLRPWLRLVTRRFLRIAFGTDGAHDNYVRAGLLRIEPTRYVPKQSQEIDVFPALPAPCDCQLGQQIKAATVFLGTFDERKGVLKALAAWEESQTLSSGGKFVIMGQGELLGEVRRRTQQQSGVTLIEKPTREQIHRALSSARVVIAPSQRTPVWREQVGLPILEGLSHGCMVLASDETGIAVWLEANGHAIVRADAPSAIWADALDRLHAHALPVEDVLRALPNRDTRVEAEAWLYRG